MGLTHLRLRTLLYSGIGGLVAIAVVVAGFGIERLSQAGAAVASMSSTAEATAVLDETILQFETIRRDVLRLRSDVDPDAVRSVRAALGEASELVKVSANNSTSDERRKSYQALEQDVQVYAGLFERQVELADRAAAQREKLFAGGDKLTKAARQLLQTAHGTSGTDLADTAADVERAIFELRVDAWRFLAIRDPAGPMTVTAAREKVGGTLIKLDEVADDATRWMIAPVSMAVVLFGESFDDLADTSAEINKTYLDDMAPRIIAMQRLIETNKRLLMSNVIATEQFSNRLIIRATYLQMAITAVTLLLGLGLALLVGRGVMQPLTRMTAAMLGLSSGDMEVPIPAHERKDEVGDMARAVVVFRRNMILAKNLSSHHDQMRADTMARQVVMRQKSEDFGTSVNEVMDALMAAAANVFGVAGVMTDASTEMNEKSSATSNTSLKASEDLTVVVGTIELLTSGFKETVRGVTAAAQLSRQAMQRVESSQDSIRDLADATGLIVDVVRAINDIARQTNMLALNATIEAARAGEAGKGFAVVAMEVKALAGQTARATGQIGGQIEKVRNTTETAVVAMKEIGGMISRMNDFAMGVAEGVGEQSLTTEGVAHDIKLVSTTTAVSAHDMASLISNANVQSLESSEGMLFGVTDIGQEVERLREIVNSYITHVTEDIAERRQFGRLDGCDNNATLLVPGHEPIRATIEDISVGGVLLRTNVTVIGGTPVAIDLPGPGGTVSGMVIRSADDEMSVTFFDNEATRTRVTSVMDAISNALIVNPSAAASNPLIVSPSVAA